MNSRPLGLRTWIEIDKKAVVENYRVFRSHIPSASKLMAVVKSNAYGHGLFDFSKEITEAGADWLGVDSATEALALRRNEIKKPILILGYTLPEMIPHLIENDVSFTVSNIEHIKALKSVKTDKEIKVHIKAETGMNRQGFLEKEMGTAISSLIEIKNVKIEGLFTHFAMAKNPAFPQYVNMQLANFEKWIKYLKSKGQSPIIHASATAGTILYPNSIFDMARVGIGLYGLWPSKETEAIHSAKLKLTPALSWKTLIGEVKSVEKGSRVGYDCTEYLEKDSRIAICPIGYWHGYPRALSSIGPVLVRGKKVRVIGRVSMDMIALDVSAVNGIQINDVVTLIGKDGKEEITADNLASLIDLSPYELITRINPLIKRIYV